MSSWRNALLLIMLAWEALVPRLAGAQDVPSFERRVWGRAEGAPQSAYGIAQDGDGLLWFATAAGLYRYDGARFTREDAVYGQPLQSSNVIAVVSTRAGIAVGYQFGGVSLFTHAGVRHYTGRDGLPAGSVGTLVVDRSGQLYAGTSTGLARLAPDGARWQVLPPIAATRPLFSWMGFDAGGTLWAVADTALYALPAGATRFRRIAGLRYDALPAIVRGSVVAYADGARLLRYSPTGVATPVRQALGIESEHILFEGPHATLWGWLKGGTTLLRAAADGTLHAARQFEGGDLPGRMVTRTLVDREDNLWVATLEGVERYRMHRLRTLALLPTAIEMHVGRGLGDDILVASGNNGPAWRATPDGLAALPGIVGVSASHRQGADSLWLGGTSGIYHVTPAGTAHWPLPPYITKSFGVQQIVTDRTGNVWIAIPRHGLFRFDAGSWTKLAPPPGPGDETPICMLAGASGRTWLGYTGGRVAELTPAGPRFVATGLAASMGNILSLLEHDGKLLIGGERGVAWLRADGVVRPLQPQHAPAFMGVSGMGIDRLGGLWLHGLDGLQHIAPADLRAFWAGATRALPWEVFDFEEGLRGQVMQIRPLPSLLVAADGKVYYATTSQVGWIDPAAVRRNVRPPTVLIEAVRVRGHAVPAVPGMVLPAGTTGIDIPFAATALSIPQRVRFRYRLAGVDAEWQVPQGERAARYTNLGPGDYRFEVTAANEDGVWNATGAELSFRIAPLAWQTYWFRAGAVVLLVLAGVALYRWRMAAVGRRAAEHAATRLAERERIARNLHDNLLQGVQGLILSCHAVLMRLPAGTPEQRALNDAMARADQMIGETRDEVMDLRQASSQHQLRARLARTVERFGGRLRDGVDVELRGDLDRLRLDVANEIAYVLQEAVANGAQHAGAARIRVVVEESSAGVTATVTDDGCGIPLDIASDGKPGHWGLAGMRERMARLGGTVAIEGRAGRGTTVTLTVPAQSAYPDG
ncbi:sensor histidine kinase [Pseudoduganella armeniaca]|nr:sensor histidine kinase [Pseudoduganella armeniaca]